MNAADRLDQIQARADKATAGPWRDGLGTHGLASDGPEFCEVWAPRSDPDRPYRQTTTVAELDLNMQSGADAEFIAAAREDLPALVNALRAVLNLHYPITGGDDEGFCNGCDGWFPCPNVRDIESALGGVS